MACRRLLWVALVAALLSVCAGAPPRRSIMAAAPSPGAAGAPSPDAAAAAPRCTASGPLEAGKRINVSLEVGSRPRSFLLMLPKDFNTTHPPLMLVLHGAGSTAAGFLDGAPGSVLQGDAPGTKLDVKGSAAGFVVAAPQGVRGGVGGDASKPGEAEGAKALAAAAAATVGAAAERLLPKQRWSNATAEGDRLHAVEKAEAEARDARPPDDVAFLYAVATCVRDTLSVPLSDQLFATGWSMGGKLASNLACVDPDAPKPGREGFTLAALAVGAGVSPVNCTASAAVPLLMLQGGDDKLVPFCDDGAPYKAGATSLSAWAAVRGCPPLNRSSDSGWTARCGAGGEGEDDLRLYTPSRCDKPDAAPVALYWLPKLPHDVPSGNLPGLNGTFADLVVGFLKSVLDGKPEVAPLRSATQGEPPMASCSGSGPCASEKGVLGKVRSAFNG